MAMLRLTATGQIVYKNTVYGNGAVAELPAILIRTGKAGESALQVGEKITESLRGLSRYASTRRPWRAESDQPRNQ